MTVMLLSINQMNIIKSKFALNFEKTNKQQQQQQQQQHSTEQCPYH